MIGCKLTEVKSYFVPSMWKDQETLIIKTELMIWDACIQITFMYSGGEGHIMQHMTLNVSIYWWSIPFYWPGRSLASGAEWGETACHLLQRRSTLSQEDQAMNETNKKSPLHHWYHTEIIFLNFISLTAYNYTTTKKSEVSKMFLNIFKSLTKAAFICSNSNFVKYHNLKEQFYFYIL